MCEDYAWQTLDSRPIAESQFHPTKSWMRLTWIPLIINYVSAIYWGQKLKLAKELLLPHISTYMSARRKQIGKIQLETFANALLRWQEV